MTRRTNGHASDGGGFAAMLWAFRLRHPAVVLGTRHILVELARYADPTGRCFPSVARIAAATGHDRRTVQRTLRTLERIGVLVTERRGDGRGHPSRYRLAVDLAQLDLDLDAESDPERAAPRRPLKAERAAPRRPLDTVKGGVGDTKGRCHAAPTTRELPTERERERARAQTSSFPSDMQLSDAGRAVAERHGLDPVETWAKYRAHRLAKGIKSPDWQADWELWCMREVERRPASERLSPRQELRKRWHLPSHGDAAVAALDRMAAEEDAAERNGVPAYPGRTVRRIGH